MRKADELADANSCLNNARDDEMLFVLLERDDAVPAAIRAWVAKRIELGLNRPEDKKIREAIACIREKGKRVDSRPEDYRFAVNDPRILEWRGYPYPRLKSGEYGKDIDGVWWCIPPNKDPFIYTSCLAKHTITEHEDGTLTAHESIHEGVWHGYLERGVWRECA
jgi:hypothetical protein